MSDIIKITYSFLNFISFITRKPNSLISLKAIKRGSQFKFIPIVYQQTRIYKYDKFILSDDFLFTSNEFRTRLPELLSNWFKLTKELESMYILYSGMMNSEIRQLDYRFLCFISALESYHRIKIRNEEIDEDSYNEMIKLIINNCPIKHKEWLKNKLKYKNEPSLRNRLNDLIDIYSDILQYDGKSKNTFISDVVDTRNYLVHYDKRLSHKRLRLERLYWASESLKLLIELCLLRELGFNNKEIKDIYSKPSLGVKLAIPTR
jgi:hypothetical protein